MKEININQLADSYNQAKTNLKQLCKDNTEFNKFHNYILQYTNPYNTLTPYEETLKHINEVNNLIKTN